MKYLFFILLFLTSTLCLSQNSGFKFRSIDYGTGVYSLKNKNINYGINGNIEIATEINSHILSTNIVLGYAISKEKSLDNLFHFFFEMDVLYGREFRLSEKIFLETNIGPGYISQTEVFSNNDHENLGLSTRIKLKFPITEELLIGLNPNLNLNNYNNIYSLQLFLQHKF